jgi:phosphoserine phosphatase RsbU/P
MRILIAEDESVSRKTLTIMLTKMGFEVDAVEDGLQAFENLMKEDSPPMAILDWMMPGMDGIDVCRKYREETAAAETKYIIILTAKSEAEDVVQGLSQGADDYITKPFNRGELVARLRVGQRLIESQRELSNKILQLNAAAEKIRSLEGIVPICMHCHDIRDDTDTWQKMETYVEKHSLAEFSHSICPTCMEQRHPE